MNSNHSTNKSRQWHCVDLSVRVMVVFICILSPVRGHAFTSELDHVRFAPSPPDPNSTKFTADGVPAKSVDRPPENAAYDSHMRTLLWA